MTREARHKFASAAGWESCGACTLDDCCGALVPRDFCTHERGIVRCTKPSGHEDEEHVACFTATHRAFAWREARA